MLAASIPQTSEPNRFIMLPFAILLLLIAFAPLILRHHWERYYHKVCIVLAGIVCGYYILAIDAAGRVLHAGRDYFSFMVVVGSFFVVTGGIHLRTSGAARPAGNTLFLLAGALLANLIGTIGASVLLIRPWIRINKDRFAGMHLAFFVFIVSNVGGALLPVGPPLFLGFLKGVPFWWTLQHCWLEWSATLGLVLIVFYFADRMNLYAIGAANRETHAMHWDCDGKRNCIFLALILAALIFMTGGLRETIMIAAAVISYLRTPARVHEANNFSFAPIKEVGWLFLGIFGTMIPVLDYMELHAANLGLRTDFQFYWATGVLSGLLDNAPTYLAFFAGALGLHDLHIENGQDVSTFVAQHGRTLAAISLGATCFGALTYIGNSPNLLIKTMAEHARVPTPGFFSYTCKFAIPVLLPIFAIVSILFFWR
jgi:Na+/H+ antiporter NhaD/arsenite permease-like protein